MKPKLSAPGLMINGKYYRVMDFPYEKVKEEGPKCLMKAVAYRIKTQFTDGLFPYRGIVGTDRTLTFKNSEVGIYYRKHGNALSMIIRRPITKREKTEYSIQNEMDVAIAFVDRTMSADQLTNISAAVEVGGNAFRPPIRPDDDALNKIMKAAIRLKNAPFEPYGKVLESSAGGVGKSAEGTNIRNNTRRMLLVNSALSAGKYSLCEAVWQLDTAIIVRDAPNAVHPMFKDGEMMVFFPNGHKFDIIPDKFVNAEEIIEAAIDEVEPDENDDIHEEEEEE